MGEPTLRKCGALFLVGTWRGDFLWSEA